MSRCLTKRCERARPEGSVACRVSLVPNRAAIVLLVACAAVLALASGPANAAPKSVVHHFGSLGTAAGQFSSPAGLAFNQGNDHLYVVDSGNNRIQQFDPMGNFVRAWGWDVELPAAEPPETPEFEVCDVTEVCKAGVAGGGAGQVPALQGIAVGEDSDHVYVTNQGNRRVEEFEADGTFVRAWGWDVQQPAAVPPETPVFEVCGAMDSCQPGLAGSGAGQFGASMGNL